MATYETLGIRPVVNAAGTLTMYGGSLMPPEVTEAMVQASQYFVDMAELHHAAGRRIAELVGAPAAHVCCGAAAGIAVMAAACMAGTDRDRIRRLPDTTGMRRRFVIQRSHHNAFDQALRLTGGEFADVGPTAAALAAAVNDAAAGVYFTLGWFCSGDSLPLDTVASIAHKAGVPVIVDAAAEVPPVTNLSRFLNEGADLVVFSGGKAIRGPQASGFIIGRPDLVEACRLNDAPNMSVGRPMKVGKEEIAGLVKAVELYVAKDHAAEMAGWERTVAQVIEALSCIPGVRAWRQLPWGVGQQIPHAAISWDENTAGRTHVDVARRLLSGEPRIAVQVIDPQVYAGAGFTSPELRIHPHTLQPGEETVVSHRLAEELAAVRTP